MSKIITQKRILLTQKSIRSICDELEVSAVTVYSALRYKSNSSKSQQIRKIALAEYEGVEVEEKKIVVAWHQKFPMWPIQGDIPSVTRQESWTWTDVPYIIGLTKVTSSSGYSDTMEGDSSPVRN